MNMSNIYYICLHVIGFYTFKFCINMKLIILLIIIKEPIILSLSDSQQKFSLKNK